MIKYPITYVDYNDNERTEEFCFNISKAELADLQLKTPGGFAEMLEEIVKSQDSMKIAAIFEDIILMSYGVRSEDGKYFEKSEEEKQRFKNSAAFSELYMSLLSDVDKASAFVKGILPKMTSAEEAQAQKMLDEKGFNVNITNKENHARPMSIR